MVVISLISEIDGAAAILFRSRPAPGSTTFQTRSWPTTAPSPPSSAPSRRTTATAPSCGRRCGGGTSCARAGRSSSRATSTSGANYENYDNFWSKSNSLLYGLYGSSLTISERDMQVEASILRPHLFPQVTRQSTGILFVADYVWSIQIHLIVLANLCKHTGHCDQFMPVLSGQLQASAPRSAPKPEHQKFLAF